MWVKLTWETACYYLFMRYAGAKTWYLLASMKDVFNPSSSLVNIFFRYRQTFTFVFSPNLLSMAPILPAK